MTKTASTTHTYYEGVTTVRLCVEQCADTDSGRGPQPQSHVLGLQIDLGTEWPSVRKHTVDGLQCVGGWMRACVYVHVCGWVGARVGVGGCGCGCGRLVCVLMCVWGGIGGSMGMCISMRVQT